MRHWRRWSYVSFAAISVAAVAATGCGKKDESSSASDVTLSGSMSTSAMAATARSNELGREDAGLALNELAIYCVTFTVPPAAGTATVGSDGSFSVTISGASGKKLGCFITKAADSSVLGTLVFADSSESSLSGGSSTSDSMSFEGEIKFGAIVFDPVSGKATVDVAKISGTVKNDAVAAGAAFDFSGNWQIKGIPTADLTAEEKKSFSVSVCAAGSNNGPSGCHGPSEGEKIHLKRVVGKKGDNDAYAMMVWASNDIFTACGSKLGETYADLKTMTKGIDFSGSGIAEGKFVFSSTVSYTDQAGTAHTNVALTDGWKLADAKVEWEQKDCGPVTLADGKRGWKCTDGSGNYQIHLGGGCTSDGKPIEIKDWSKVTGQSWSCAAKDSAGYRTCTSTGTYDSKTIKCSNTDGTFTSTGAITDSFNWSTVAVIAAKDTLCSSVNTATNRGKLVQLQCYSNAYWRSGLERSTGGYCLRDIRTNWATEDPAQFLSASDDPRGLHIANLFKYSSDGNSGSLYDESEEFEGVEVSDGTNKQYVPCRILQKGSLKVAKVSDTRMKVNYSSTAINLSTESTACAAKFTGTAAENFLFYLDKI